MNKPLALLLACSVLPVRAEDFVASYLKHRFDAQAVEMREIESLESRIVDGKLHLNAHDFIELMLKNSTNIRISQLDVYTAEDAITSAKALFDPLVSAQFNALRSLQPFSFGGGGFIGTGTGTTTGTGNGSGTETTGFLPQTISSLTQNTGLTYTQLLPTGQTLSANFAGSRTSGDEYPFPAVFGTFNFTLAQPLLQNRTNIQARGPLKIARTALVVASDQTEAAISDAVSEALDGYWSAVSARDAIKVQEQTVALAQKSYERDKMALDLGALASLDIYQSQTQVAERNRDLVQAQYAYRTALDGLRRFIGADLTPRLRATEIVLDDDPTATPDRSEVLPFETALTKALAARPELKAIGNQLAIDHIQSKIAKDSLLPQLNLTANGGSSGPAFNPVQVGGTVGIPATPYPGYGETLKQVLGFDFPSYGFGLVLNFPFRNSAAQAQLADAYVSRARHHYQQRQTQQTITLDVRQAIDNIELSEASIKAAITARDLARKNVDAEQQKYQLGTITAFELLDSQNRLASAENALLSAYVVYQKAFVDYRHATATLLSGFNIVKLPKR